MNQTKKHHAVNRKPIVSVVIPVFNGAKYIEETVESVQKSTYKQFEILLIDDGSNDHSKHVCEALDKRYKNVRFFTFRKNQGLGRVLNFALKTARGKYICRINQDDRMLPHRIKTQVEHLESHPGVVALGSCISLFDNNGNHQIVKFLEHDEEIKSVWYIVSPFSDPSVMYHREVALQAGGYDQNFWPADDTHLWYRMGMLGKLANLSEPVVEVRWHNEAASVLFFRRLAISTFNMHRWTHAHIAPASWYVQLYWVIQLMAGLTLTPQVNWGVYRIMKKAIYHYERFLETLVQNNTNKPTAPAVIVHPRMASASGK